MLQSEEFSHRQCTGWRRTETVADPTAHGQEPSFEQCASI